MADVRPSTQGLSHRGFDSTTNGTTTDSGP